MPSIINATTTNGVVTSGDNSGALVLATNNNTTAVTIGTNQAATFAQTLNAPNTFGFKNRIINGTGTVSQYYGSSSFTPIGSSTYFSDCWGSFNSAASKFSFQQNAGSVTPPAGFSTYLGFTSLSSYSIGASEIFGFAQIIEGYNIADLNWGTSNAKNLTISFWVRSSLTGTFGGFLKNGGNKVGGLYNNLFRTISYTINAANTWEYKTIFIEGSTTGNWQVDNGPGLCLAFSLGAGTSASGGSSTWSSSFFCQPSGSTNIVATNGATFYITGIQFEVGTTATSFDVRSYTTELTLCQRYAYKRLADGSINDYAPLGQGRYYGTNVAQLYVPFPVTMRTSPSSITVSGTILVNDTGFGGANWTSPVLNETSCDGTTVTGSTTTGTTAGNATTFYVNGSGIAFIIFNAEL
jgi:hypothetical protein